MNDQVMLEGIGLVKRYGGITAVNGVDIRVHAGEVLGLVGPNGAGKTTLVDLITGAQRSDAGELTLQGKKLSGSAAARASVGLARTFQHPQIAVELSVRDNLVLGGIASRYRSLWSLVTGVFTGPLHPHSGADDQLAEQLRADLGLPDLHLMGGQLTLGEQRLVEVGRALGADPKVLLLDEPFAGADARGIAGISEAIHTLRRKGQAVILVDHNVDLVAALVDRIVLLESGSVAYDGDPEECLASPEMQWVYFGTGPVAAKIS